MSTISWKKVYDFESHFYSPLMDLVNLNSAHMHLVIVSSAD